VNKKARTRLIVATVVIVAVFVVGVVWVMTSRAAYYRQVSQVVTGTYDGKNVQVGGRVMGDTIARDDAGVHFTIQDLSGKIDTVKVDYSGQMPNTFGPDVDVVVTGTYSGGLISADKLETKCPSKYQGQGTTPTPATTQ
jgi:cytochrome c-type biogenesis protein CcmE